MTTAWDTLCNTLGRAEPALCGAGGAIITLPAGLAARLAAFTQPVWLNAQTWQSVLHDLFSRNSNLAELVMEDLTAIAGRNLEEGGLVATWIGGRGFHALFAHRAIHALWQENRQELAQALKASLYTTGCDIHPAARFGRRIFLDHAVGTVIGETATIGDDVSLWHGVTLGSTLMEEGDRHPKIGPGAVIGAGAIILGNITIGRGAIVAAGSVVLHAVPPWRLVAGNPAALKTGYVHPFGMKPEQD
ncbi:serine acetyltransferase [Komagataeibacter medellinensis]|uniref:Serine acetyltransferase n=2 Tax=Komagataeibacter medellinensis TaxID=1177712 RepID=G2I269_KOMMN|nr:serine O-acetyltransferase [Komagataeibacter medellinensis]KAB8123154.1 serine acetyltransferase [Komagataeibacter medellinensis]BAK82485.1 serine O-acetyltransferase [Komagataeibacter medellinensis NBRC 3288]